MDDPPSAIMPDSSSSQIELTLTNPGIISRLNQDIIDYLSSFGYRLTHSSDSVTSNDSAVLTVPLLADTRSVKKILHIHNHDESLIPTIGPLIRTYIRLSDANLHPKRLRAIVDCLFTINIKDKTIDDMEEAAAKRMAHHIHMVIRNSMGSALFLDLVVVLPCYSCANTPLSMQAVKNAMNDNVDTCYPCVTLIERNRSEVDDSVVHNFSVSKNSVGCSTIQDGDNLHLHIHSRMCTVRHQPKIFRWLYATSPSSLSMDASVECSIELQMTSKHQRQPRPPIVIACIEKVANLHRILMLCYDYDKSHLLDGSSSVTGVPEMLLLNVIVVMPRDDLNSNCSSEKDGDCGCNSAKQRKPRKQQTKTLLEYYNEAIEHFHSVVFGECKDPFNFYRPKFIYEDEAIESISRIFLATKQCSSDFEGSPQPSVVGIDIHPNALTLCGDYDSEPNSNRRALHTLQNAQAIVFGYESTGIPDYIRESSLLNEWVQIPCRSSINVVASMSIIFYVLLR